LNNDGWHVKSIAFSKRIKDIFLGQLTQGCLMLAIDLLGDSRLSDHQDFQIPRRVAKVIINAGIRPFHEAHSAFTSKTANLPARWALDNLQGRLQAHRLLYPALRRQYRLQNPG
jgi:hypothetical protein